MAQVFKLLFVEDVPTDVELILRELRKASFYCEHKTVVDGDSFQKALMSFKPDVIVSDYSLPSFDAIEALKIRNFQAPIVPFVLVTGAQTEEVAAECIKLGADDYILKSSLTRIPTALINAIDKKTAEKSKQEALQKLQYNEEKYRNLFENSLVGMFRADGSTCLVTEANKQIKNILGGQKVEGLSLKDLFWDDKEFLNFCKNLKQSSSIKDLEFQLNTGTSTIWVSLSAKFYEKDNLIEGTIVDITSSKNNLLKLEKVNNELELFAYHASHDLKSPLKSVIGLILAIREENNQEELNELIDFLEISTERMESLINDLLTAARLSRREIETDGISFSTEMPQIINALSFLENTDKLQINYSVNQSCDFFSDKTRVRTVLRNLVENAIKYHSLSPNAFVDIDVNVNAKEAVIVVKDNGKGIEPVHQRKIFNMFYRASTDSEGTGLGLYIVKNTIEALNGKIEMNSVFNKGTVFTISIPNLPDHHKKFSQASSSSTYSSF